MTIDGIYGFVYCGANDLGIGAFIVEGGSVRGVDLGGGRYTGTAVEDPKGHIRLDIEFDVPAGMVLVQGTAPQELPHRRRINQTFPPLFGDGRPVETSTPPVTVMMKRLPPTSMLPEKLGLVLKADKPAGEPGGISGRRRGRGNGPRQGRPHRPAGVGLPRTYRDR